MSTPRHTEHPTAEFTVKAAIAGAIFGLVFGTANTYLGLKVGLTVSTSIPVAVLTIAAFSAMRFFGGRSTIHEHNISQTVGSASSSLASGVIFTIPALFLWGANPSLMHISLLALTGGILGIAFMIPLRRLLIVKEHDRLPYPEGTACAEVLTAAEEGGSKAKYLFVGLGLGAVYKWGIGAAHLWKETISTRIPALPKSVLGIEATPALLGVGFILGPRIGAVMVGGAALSWLVIIPLIAKFGAGLSDPVFPEASLTIAEMTPKLIWTRYIRYVGAGAVATAGIITIIRSVPTMIASIRIGIAEMKRQLGGEVETERTQRDLSFRTVLIIVGCVAAVIVLVPGLVGGLDSIFGRLVVAIAVTIFAFLFVTVSSRIVGLIGVSSNPTSGMTIVTLLGTSVVFYWLGWTDMVGQITALSVGTVVCVAASIAGDTSQDLKTGYLVGATPYKQQIGEFIGATTSAMGVAFAVTLLGNMYGFGSTDLPAPQATLMKTVIEGVLSAEVPWELVITGAFFAIVVELLHIPSLPFAVGVYLPLATMTPIFFGGLIRRLVERINAPKHDDDPEELKPRRRMIDRGILIGSGMIAGEGLVGVGIAFYALLAEHKPEGIGVGWAGDFATPLAIILFLGLASILVRRYREDRNAPPSPTVH